MIYFEPLSGQKITVALGQRGSTSQSGCGGTFVITYHEIYKGAREPIFVAGGAAADAGNPSFSKASLHKTAHGNNEVGSSGTQTNVPGYYNVMTRKRLPFDYCEVYCAGAGFLDAPKGGYLVRDPVPPENYSQGLKGGKGKIIRTLTEGGFGGGGAAYCLANNKVCNHKDINYFGAGGGFTGGSSTGIHSFSLTDSGPDCYGGGGGSYSSDQNAAFDYALVSFGKCKLEFIT